MVTSGHYVPVPAAPFLVDATHQRFALPVARGRQKARPVQVVGGAWHAGSRVEGGMHSDDALFGPDSDNSSPGDPVPRGCILYIEDNSDNRTLIKRVLEAAGYNVLLAESGAQGIVMATNEIPDLILMDINLPDIDGYTCTDLLRQQAITRQIPILALTANVLEGDRQKALGVGCDGYIPKPIDVDDLPAQIAAYISTPGIRSKTTDAQYIATELEDTDQTAEHGASAKALHSGQRATHKGQMK
jgi:two-component system cell cycle response regulator DivK